MKKNLGVFFILCVLSVLVISGCGKDDKISSKAKPVITIMSPDNGRVNKEDNLVIEEIGKKTGVKIELNLVAAAEFQNKLNVMVVSDNMPDIIRTVNYDFFEYVQQSALYDMTKLIDTKGDNIKKNIPKEVWDKISYNGKYYAIPCYNWAGKSITAVRQDWIDKLDLKVPQTLEELREVYIKMTYGDPDGNGKNDTYGLTTSNEITFTAFPETFTNIFGAFGVQPGQYFEKNGMVMPASISPEYKAALEFLNKLYSEDKVIDPDIFIVKTDQARQSIAQGKAGLLTGWWSVVPQVLTQQLKMNENNPNVKWSIVPPIKGENAVSGLRSAGVINGAASISNKCKNPEAAFQLLEYLASDEGAILANYGILDTHYTIENGVRKETPEGKKAKDGKWLDSLALLVQRTDITMDYFKNNQPISWQYVEAARDNKLYFDFFEGVSTAISQKYITDIKKLEQEWLIKFVTGKEPISKFDTYVSQWKMKGGEEMLNSLTEEYNNRNGKSLKAFKIQ